MKGIKFYISLLLFSLATTTLLQAQLLPQKQQQRRVTAYNIWEGFNFQTTPPERYKTTLADFLMLTADIPNEDEVRLLNQVIDSAVINSAYVSQTVDVTGEFYNHPNSPFRDEKRYIEILHKIINNPDIADVYKISPQMKLEQLLKNSEGVVATDFSYETIGGEKGSLHSISAAYTILFFNDPDCSECASVKSQFTTLPQITTRGDVKILAIYPDDDFELWKSTIYPQSTQWINACDPTQMINNEQLYHITALPTLYLLDSEKRVILKDVYAEQIIDFLSKNRAK